MTETARILVYDIEATNLDAEFGYVLAIGYKFVGEPDNKTVVLSIDQFPRYEKDRTDDRPILKAFEPVYKSADAILHFNGIRYDEPFVNTRRLVHGMDPLPRKPRIDLLYTAKSTLRIRSKSLDRVAKLLQTKNQKSPVTGRHWVRAMSGYKESLQYISRHCRADVLVLEEVYLRLRGRVYNHPRVSTDIAACRFCGGRVIRRGYALTALKNRPVRVQCVSCRSWDQRVIPQRAA